MRSINKIFELIEKEILINKIKILMNISIFFIISKITDTFYSYDNKIKYYYKKVFLPCEIKWRKINYFFQLNSFIELYEEGEFLEEILDSEYEVFIDVWSNIWRISSLVAVYNKKYIKIVALEPNINCTLESLKYIPNEIKEKIEFLNYWLWDVTKNSTMTIISNASATTMWTLEKEKSGLKDLNEYAVKKIDVKILSFKDFFEENKLYIYRNFLIKIDVEWYEEYVLKSFFDFIWSNLWKYKFKIIIEILPRNEDLFKKLEKFWIKKDEIKKLWNWNDYMFKIN